MGWNLMKRIRFLWLALFLLPVTAWPAEFSAQMIVKDGDKTMPGKIYVRDGQMRQEFNDETGETITVVRPDKKVVWALRSWTGGADLGPDSSIQILNEPGLQR